MPVHRPSGPGLSLEGLEERTLLSATSVFTEPFQTATTSGLPTGWTQWSSNGTNNAFQDVKTGGLGDQGELTAAALTGVTSRAWDNTYFQADIEATAAVYLNSTVPIQLYVRGKGLNTADPTYYAVSVTRGGTIELLRVVDGHTTIIGSARSGSYVSNVWLQVTIEAVGQQLMVQVSRSDTGQYLDTAGDWVRGGESAITVSDSAIASGGQVGFDRGNTGTDKLILDSLRVNTVSPGSQALYLVQRFDGEVDGSLPDGWSVWSKGTGSSAATTPDQLLQLDGNTNSATRVWIDQSLPADVQVSASVEVTDVTPAELIARGQNLGTDRPTYYAVEVSRGVTVQLVKVVSGAQTVLGTIKSKDWVSGQWLEVSIVTKGDQIRAQVFRTDTSEYLNADGTWTLAPSWALIRTDSAITRGGDVGLGRGVGSAAPLYMDNFVVSAAPSSWNQADPIPIQNDKTTPAIPTSPPPPGGGGTNPPPNLPPPTVGTGTGKSTGTGSSSLPAVPQHLSWIRVAELAYYGTPIDAELQSLLKNSVDLVIPNTSYLQQIADTAPHTPQLIYTNLSNIYQSLITDWLEYAKSVGANPEDAFYHVTKPTAYSGLSASAIPVNQFWGVYRGSSPSDLINLTNAAQSTTTPVALGGLGQSLDIGYPEEYRSINFNLVSGAAAGWTGTVQYVTAVDRNGNPTAWATLNLLSDTTDGLRKSGEIQFNPPANWVASSIGGSARLYYVRVLTTHGGTPPVAMSILGDDYTNSKGTNSGTIPVFDYAADKNHDGYLDDAEWAARKPGDNARFAYQSRLFYPNYGPNRFATDVSNPVFRAWAENYISRLAASEPLASGFFVDNSGGHLAVDPSTIAESLTNYSADYGSLLGAIQKELSASGKWLAANTSGGGNSVDPILQNGVSSLEEFALRPQSANYVQLEDMLATVSYRQQISGGKAYQILDSLPTNGVSATDPRFQLSTLAMYYLMADPKNTFLLLNGGNSPASDWSQHWTNAINYNVGKPTGTAYVFSSGQDPSNSSLSYKVYARDYQNALVLYKPLSYNHGVTGGIGTNTDTTTALGGSYREVMANGSLGPIITRITLANGEGVVLAKVG